MSDAVRTDLALSVPLTGVQAVEASAGTGKTYALAGIHARLIVEKKLEVREILVVTYTRAAADELRARLRERLALCAQIAEEVAPTSDGDAKPEADFCRELITNALAVGESRESLLRRLRLAALSLDEAQISTVHAFCERALRELAWSAGVPALDGELIDANELSDDLAADLWRERATGADALAWNALLALTKSAKGFAYLLRELRDADSVLEPEVAVAGEALRGCVAQGATARHAFLQRWLSEQGAAFDTLLAQLDAKDFNGNKLRRKTLIADRETMCGEAARGEMASVDTWSKYVPAMLAEKWNNPRKAFVPPTLLVALESTLQENAQADLALRQLGLLVLRDCAAELRRRLQRQQREARGYSYDDLIARLHEAVCGPNSEETAGALAQRYSAALVDECQDSDARQFEIFFAIYRQRGLLCLIGDPKQSIYRFRGGDVRAYLNARDRADERHALDCNFRSTPALIGALNRLYAEAGDKAFGDKLIQYMPVCAGGTTQDDDLLIEGVAPVPLRFWNVADAQSNKDEGMGLLAAGCAEEVVRLLSLAQSGAAQLRRRQEDGSRQYEALRAKDLAVLVGEHRQATAMQRALLARGVPSVVISRASVFASDEARELFALLRALDSFDPTRLRGALTTRLLGKTLSEIAALDGENQPWHDHAAHFAAWRELWQRRGVLALVERIAESAAAALLARTDGERRLTNLLHLAELLQQAEQERDGARALIDWLQQRIAHADDKREEEQLRLESDAGRVHIVTVHKSKGLEYPIVFLPFAALRRRSRGRDVEVYARFEGMRRIVHVGAAGGDDAQASAYERSEAQAEGLRLLYVALTRARVACYVAWGEVGKGDQVPALAALLGTSADPAVPVKVSKQLDALAASAPTLIDCAPLPESTSRRVSLLNATQPPAARQMSRRVQEWRSTHSFSRLHAGAHESLRSASETARGEDESNVDTVAFANLPAALPSALRGARFGTAFHELMENVDFRAWRNWHATSAPAAQRELLARVLRRYALDNAANETGLHTAFTRLVAATLNAPLPLGARLADLAPAQYRVEMPFHFAIDAADAQQWLACMHAHGYLRTRTHFALEENRLAGLMTGILDLVVLHDARWWVVDYKTNLLGLDTPADYAPTRLDTAVRDGEYDLQYLIYLVALHRWLKLRLGSTYNYDRDIGGALYLFVRGLDRDGINGVHQDKPPAALIEALDAMLKPSLEIAV